MITNYPINYFSMHIDRTTQRRGFVLLYSDTTYSRSVCGWSRGCSVKKRVHTRPSLPIPAKFIIDSLWNALLVLKYRTPALLSPTNQQKPIRSIDMVVNTRLKQEQRCCWWDKHDVCSSPTFGWISSFRSEAVRLTRRPPDCWLVGGLCRANGEQLGRFMNI